MMRRLPPLNALRVFEAAARHLNFSAAASELCVTHGAVSHQIRILEDWLGQPLFHRHSNGVHLTETGNSLQQVTHMALDQLEERYNAIRSSQTRPEIVLGAPGSFLANWLIPRLGQFETDHPDIRLRLQTGTQTEELTNRQVDALILSGRAPWSKTFEITKLLDEQIGPVCAGNYPTPPHTPGDLGHLPLLHTTSRPHAWQEWADTQKQVSTFWAQGRRFDHLSLMLEAVVAGLGVGIAPALLVEREIALGRLQAPLGFCSGANAFALCILASRTTESALQTLRQWLLIQAQDFHPTHPA